MAVETSQTIFAWGQETFGAVSDPTNLVARAKIEFEELAEAVAAGAPSDAVAAEVADVAILLHRLLGVLGRELDVEVDAKMTINRRRIWVRNGDGTGRHVKV